MNRRKLLMGAAAAAAYKQIAHAQSISPQIGGGISRGFDGGISGVNSSGQAALLAIPTGAIFALSRRKIAGWSGSALRVIRSSDSTQTDIGFDASNNWDAAGMTTFAGGSNLSLVFPYDNSGNGNNGTDPGATHRPSLAPAVSTGILIDGLINFGTLVTQKTINLPAGVAFNQNNFSIFMVLRPKFNVNGQAFFSFPIASPALTGVYSTLSDTDGTQVGTTSGISNSASLFKFANLPPLSTSIMSFVGNGTTGTATINGTSRTFTTSSQASAGGMLGALAGFLTSFTGAFDLEAFLVYPTALSVGNQNALNAALASAYGVPAAFSAGQVICDGDSITQSYGTTLNRCWPKTLAANLPNYQFFNMGIGGVTMAGLLSGQSAKILGRFNGSFTKNILTIWGGTNDIQAGVAATTVFANLTSYSTAAKSTGFKVVWITMLPRTDLNAAAQTQWANYNTAMRAATLGTGSTADALADVQSDATMGPFAAAANNSLYCNNPGDFSVGVHPTDAGSDIIAPYIQTAVNSL